MTFGRQSRAILVLGAVLVLGCSDVSVVRGSGSASALGAGEATDRTIRVVDENCSTVHVRPDDQITVWFGSGAWMRGRAKNFCTDRTGIGLSKGDGFCFEGDIVPWKYVASVKIDQVDEGTVLAAVVLTLPSIVVLAMTGTGGVIARLGSPSTENAGRCANSTLSSSVDRDPSDASLLFSRKTIRQAEYRPSLRVDAGTCLLDRTCVLGSARGGVTFFDVLDLSGGLRWEDGRTTRLMATVGLGFQARFLHAQRLAMYTGVQFGLGDGLRVAPSVGVRFRVVEGLWVGAMPLGLTYFAANDPRGKRGVLYTPSLDLGYEF
ncbi:MAG TPA: hypothetical protein VM925_29035 [Labilithrix sp.]|nr:hypothetical protein [Labilithrix sp.]